MIVVYGRRQIIVRMIIVVETTKNTIFRVGQVKNSILKRALQNIIAFAGKYFLFAFKIMFGAINTVWSNISVDLSKYCFKHGCYL